MHLTHSLFFFFDHLFESAWSPTFLNSLFFPLTKNLSPYICTYLSVSIFLPPNSAYMEKQCNLWIFISTTSRDSNFVLLNSFGIKTSLFTKCQYQMTFTWLEGYFLSMDKVSYVAWGNAKFLLNINILVHIVSLVNGWLWNFFCLSTFADYSRQGIIEVWTSGDLEDQTVRWLCRNNTTYKYLYWRYQDILNLSF